MQSMKKILMVWIFSVVAFAQQAMEVSDIVITDLGNGLLQISVQVKNTSNKTVSEVTGYLDIYDNSGNVAETQELSIVLNSDIPLKPHQNASRSAIITQRPHMSGTVRFRITTLRFFGEQNVYLICPACGELIQKD
ncbi:MAG: hypothetical protein M0P75_00605 [Candidatus Marinimicrobia bacterium]|jgi:hypothetical protein|nr:hypothetical protein [Candidatus Neomarinimicrobiota bacterium]